MPRSSIAAVISLVTTVIRRGLATVRDFLEQLLPSAVSNPGLRNFSVAVVRPDDLLALTFEFQNLSPIDESGVNARLVRNDPGGEALMIVHFPPQSIAEKTIPEGSLDLELPIDARIS